MTDILTVAANLILQFETKDSKSGWNAEKGRWFPYSSLEGGAPTIGYGEKMSKDRYSQKEIEAITKEGISDSYAKILMRKRIAQGLIKLEGFVKTPLRNFMSNYQQAAVASYIYNVGIKEDWEFTKNLKKAARAMEAAVKEMNIITANGKILKGLVRRRLAERALFKNE